MHLRSWLGLNAARAALAIVLLHAAALSGDTAPALAAPTLVQATPGPTFLGIAANGTCEIGACPPTTAQPTTSAVTTPVSFITTLPNGDRFEVIGADHQTNQNGCGSYEGHLQVAVVYLGNSASVGSQLDTWPIDVYRDFTCTGHPSLTYSPSGAFSPNIAPGSAVAFTGDGLPVVHLGPFVAPHAFSAAQGTTPIMSGNVLQFHSTWSLTFAAGSPVGSYMLLNGAPPPPGPIVNLPAPIRIIDTRTLGAGPIAAGTSRCFAVAGVAGIPADAGAVVLNVTAVGYGTNGWLTVYPSGQSVPATSTLNFDVHEYAMANGAIMRIGPDGQVCVNVGTVGSLPGSAQVILDATGYLTATDLVLLPMLLSPQRVVDTRTAGGPIATGASSCFTVAGVAGIPSDAAAVIVNATAVGYGVPGWLTIYPNGQAVPATSTTNFDTTEYAIANGSIVRVGSGGQVCVSVGTVNAAPGAANAVLDITGYLTPAGLAQLPMLTSPQRLVDTRTTGGAISTGQSRCFTVAGQAGVPAGASAVVLNVTAVGYGTRGWLTAYPAGQAVPATSTLNFDTTEYAMANGAVMAIGSNGQVCVNVGTVGAAPGSSQVILDVVGYL